MLRSALHPRMVGVDWEVKANSFYSLMIIVPIAEV